MPGLQCTGDKSSNCTATQMFLNMHINRYKALGHRRICIFLPFSVCALVGTVTFGGQEAKNILLLYSKCSFNFLVRILGMTINSVTGNCSSHSGFLFFSF